MSATTQSTGRQHLHAATAGGQDPTRTKTIRKRYGQRLRGAYGRINAAIREAVIQRDIFNLRDDDTPQLVGAVNLPVTFGFGTDPEKVEQFEAWLREAEESEVLEVIDRGSNQYVRRAYERGVSSADSDALRVGVNVPETEVHTVVELPQHRRELELLYTRNFTELDGITRAVDQEVSRVLTEGLAAGENPTTMARDITGRIDAIGKTRATVLARTEVIRAHAAGTLTRYDQLGVDGVTVRAEFQTAGDNRVCPRCLALEGRVYTIEEARGVVPVHPQCRCAWIPVGPQDAAAAAVEAHPDAYQWLHAAGALAGPQAESRLEALASTDRAGAAELVAQAVAG